MLITTTDTLPNGQLVELLGPVVAVAVIRRALTSTPDDDALPDYPREAADFCELKHIQALETLQERATALGGNAVVGLRLHAFSLQQTTLLEICAYGTAARIREPMPAA